MHLQKFCGTLPPTIERKVVGIMNPIQSATIIFFFAIFVVVCILYFYIFKCVKKMTEKFIEVVEKEINETNG